MRPIFLFKGKARDLRAALLLAMLVAAGCWGEVGGESPTIPNVTIQDSGLPTVVSGTRIKVGYYTTPDGLRVPSDGLYWDAQWGTAVELTSTGALLPVIKVGYGGFCGGAAAALAPPGAVRGTVVSLDGRGQAVRLLEPTACRSEWWTFEDVTAEAAVVTAVFE